MFDQFIIPSQTLSSSWLCWLYLIQDKFLFVVFCVVSKTQIHNEIQDVNILLQAGILEGIVVMLVVSVFALVLFILIFPIYL